MFWKKKPSPQPKQPDRETVAGKIAEIEAEMKRAGLWQDEPLRPEQYNFRQAFGMDTMAFTQWLQFIFLPRVQQVVAGGGAFPPKSEVGAQAFRELIAYGGGSEAQVERLVKLLQEFDALFG